MKLSRCLVLLGGWSFLVLAARAPAQETTAAPLSADTVGRLRAEIRSALFVPDPLPALDAESYGQFEPAPGVVAERVSYATELGMRVPAILYLPKELKGKIPALIVVNGHGGDKSTWYSFYSGILYARAGAAVLTYDPAGEYERNSRRLSGSRAMTTRSSRPRSADVWAV